MKTIHKLLEELLACSGAQIWAEQYSTIEEILENAERGDWLLWLAKKVDVDIRPLTLAKARCAKTVIQLMKDERSINAVNVAERFGLGEATEEDLMEARRNADAATYAYDAADAAAYAAYAAAAVARATDAAYAATYAVVATYAAAAYAAARIKNRKQAADSCRETIGELIIQNVNSLLK